MNTLLELTWRGALMTGIVVLLDRVFAARIHARVRRIWWLLAPVAFLLTAPLPILPAPESGVARFVRSPATVALSAGAASRPVEQPAAIAPLQLIYGSRAFIAVLAGSAVYLLVVLIRTYSALRRWSDAPVCADPALLGVLEDCKTAAGVTAPVGLVVSEGVTAPLILGWLRPRILLPVALTASLSREQLRGVLFHELAHLRARDVPCTFLFTLVCALHWFNPAAHFALRAWTRFREEAADEAAITWLGNSSNLVYGETLLHVLRASNGPRQTSMAVLAIVESVDHLKKRLLMIKQHSSKRSHYILSFSISALVAAGILVRPVRAAENNTPAPDLASPADAAIKLVPPPVSWEFQFGGVPVAVVPRGASHFTIYSTQVTYSAKSRISTFSGTVSVTFAVPGQPAITMTGENLTASPLPTSGKAEDPAAQPTGYLLQAAGTTIAALADYPMEITTHKFMRKSGNVQDLKEAEITITPPGQAPITITGESLTLIRQK